ncbi:hypothetical protein E8E13_010003 [Curvularia kusanoi]|uniref:Aldehyde dehydrogenase domain-containing protein n=1 Tax=Curvularia kusanoi TaxID=90978 RepID=A0A9P4TI25_CURKU|nr:hypothetical protein E8E13_010003 [Curvularia kusanoi]
MADSAIAQLHATALTARCHNAFFRQKQLKSLHDGLRQDSNTLKDALKADTRVSDVQATVEVAAALELVKEHHASIDPAKELDSEYRVANGKDAGDQTKPWGVVYIEPQQNHTPLFSTISALSAALAAGNCVALKLENNLRALPTLLRTILSQAIEADTFAIVSSTPSQESLAPCFQVLQETAVQQPTHNQLASPHTKVVAIVDRTADLASAAENLVTARFNFGGTSPYAPDLIFVNEYVKKDFLEHVLKYVNSILAEYSDYDSLNSSPKSPPHQKASLTSSALQTLQASTSWRINIVTQGAAAAVVDLSNLSALPAKSTDPIFAVSSITSLEHAISVIDEASTTGGEQLLAGYYFGTAATGKYLSQFISADLSVVNHIPYRLLLGPAAPAYHAIDIDARYTVSQFSRAAPAYIAPSALHTQLDTLLHDIPKARNPLLAKALASATEEIKEKKRAEWIAIGYFEQGILIGLGVYGVPLLACIGTGLFFGVRAGLRRFAVI